MIDETHLTEAQGHRRWRLLAWLWLAVVLAVTVQQWSFWQQPRLDTDVLALLPQDEQAPEVGLATRRLVEQASRQVVVLVGAPSWVQTQQALVAWRQALPSGLGWQALNPADPATLSAITAFYTPWRDRLLTPAQRRWLQATPLANQTQSALMALMQPGTARLTDWDADPLALWPKWWMARAAETRARSREGEAVISQPGMEWAVLMFELDRSAMSLSGEAVLGDALAGAARAVHAAVPESRLLHAGVPLHAEAAAVQANSEINTIGWGSLAAVMLLIWVAFRAFRPMLLTGLSLLVGLAAASAATAMVFGQIHLVTLIFGSSLAGVAEDYGLHYFSARQADAQRSPLALMHHLLPGLLLALATSVLGYLVLGLVPFPGLRQMAFFSAVGLVATFITAACWFPWLDRGQRLEPNGFSTAVADSLQRWPRWQWNRWGLMLALMVLMAGGWGLTGLAVNDDLRQLQGSRPELVAQQREVARLLGLSSPTQFYIVTGSDEEQVLQREEDLKIRLDALLEQGVFQGHVQGYRALSDWLPSRARQQADAALTARTEMAVVSAVSAQFGQPLQRHRFSTEPLGLAAWLAATAAQPARGLWLGEIRPGLLGSVVMLRGDFAAAQLIPLAAAAQGLAGVRWTDRTAELSSLLGRYREAMLLLLVLGHVLVWLLLAWRYGRAAWRASLPTALASLLAVASLGWMGMPFQLFNVLALLLLLGVGIDYGVLLLEHRNDGAAWMAVILGASSTALAFGLLGLSGLPALRGFGVTLLVGLIWVVLLSPLLRARRPTSAQEPTVVSGAIP